MLSVKSYEIASWPRAQLCHRDFNYTNLVKVETISGYSLEIVLDEYGYPELDQSLISRIQNFYNRRFIPISLDNSLAYANIVGKNTRTYNGRQPARTVLYS